MKFHHLSLAAAALLITTVSFSQDSIPSRDTLPSKDTLPLPTDTVTVPPTNNLIGMASLTISDTTDPSKDTSSLPEDTTSTELVALANASTVYFYQDTTTDPPQDTTKAPDKDSSGLALALVPANSGGFYQDTIPQKKDTTDLPNKDSVPSTPDSIAKTQLQSSGFTFKPAARMALTAKQEGQSA